MADTKISALPSASTPLAGTEVLPIVQSGTTDKVTVDNLTAGRAVSAASVTATGTIEGTIVNAIGGTGDQFLINAKTNDGTAANNAGIGLRANSSATAGSRFAQLWFDADGGNLSGGDYFLMTKNGNDGTIDLIQYSNSAMRFAANYIGRAAIDLTIETTGNVTVNTGNLVIGTSGKGITSSGAIPLGLGTNGSTSQATLDTSGNINLASGNTFSTSTYIGINASTPTTVASGISFLAIMRCRGSGGSAVVLYENNTTPVIIAQAGAVTFVTGSPGANEIQIADGGSSITALSGSSVGSNNLNITIIKNQ